ncbi:tetratricopeptide repeat protein [Xanthobacter sp. KR7-65]|uniref:tetratricopeptide repeat protein n=1 Tax=Xanthobacter sp. KR7-65 TaxID=3156612 RepID=UPI0032B54955
MSDERISYKILKEMDEESLRRRMGASPAEAAPWVRAAAHNGIKTAQVAWGQMLLDGEGTARDVDAALRWFRIAGDAGSLDGINMVGRCHELGWGVAPDAAAAERHYRAAASLGHAWAQFNLASLLLQPDRAAADRVEALGWYVRSARGGNAKAMAMVGRFLEHGWGRQPRPLAARRWYRRAAIGGDYRGQFDFARTRYEDGFRDEALAWFARSIESAVPDFCRLAAEGLRDAGDPALDALAARALARAQDGDARRAAREAALQAEAAARRPAPRRRLTARLSATLSATLLGRRT